MVDRETLQSLIDAARLAPSSHNTQPWVFAIDDGAVRLYADRTRALPVNDPDDRELTISCGCALLTLRAAAAGQGLGAEVAAGGGDDPDLLATVRPGGAPDPALARLAPAIPERRTVRKRFAPEPPSPEQRRALSEAAGSEGATLRPVEDEDARTRVADLVAEGDRLLWSDPRWRRELAAWMHPRRKGDGLSLPGLAVPVAQLVVRSFDMGGGVAAKDRQIAEGSPLIALLETRGDAPADWLAAGQALQRVLLTAAAGGLQASYLNQPIQARELRGRLAKATGATGHPQILLRLGRPEGETPAAPRRPLAEVLSDT